ncbi:MAG TPA: hypothetical protein QF514_02175 [Candidatus Thalassarchaeaceae archaeon]|nr:hypothetical protein [Candidatus Thalassarchaeaceae archaeon]
MAKQSNNDEDTRIVQLAGAWGGPMDFHLTKQECLELIQQGAGWAYTLPDGKLVQAKEIDENWNSITGLQILPALIGGPGAKDRTSSPQVGEEE